jgi:hypothetical protein
MIMFITRLPLRDSARTPTMLLSSYRGMPEEYLEVFIGFYQFMHITYVSINGMTGSSRIRMFHPDPARKMSVNLYDIYHCCVYSEKLLMMDRGTVRNT